MTLQQNSIASRTTNIIKSLEMFISPKLKINNEDVTAKKCVKKNEKWILIIFTKGETLENLYGLIKNERASHKKLNINTSKMDSLVSRWPINGKDADTSKTIFRMRRSPNNKKSRR